MGVVLIEFKSELGYDLEVQVQVLQHSVGFDVIQVWQTMGSEVYSMMPDVVLTNNDYDKIEDILAALEESHVKDERYIS